MKGWIYEYELKSIYPQECEAVIFAYTQAGWKYVDIKPDSGFPTHIIFEWTKNSPHYMPYVNWP